MPFKGIPPMTSLPVFRPHLLNVPPIVPQAGHQDISTWAAGDTPDPNTADTAYNLMISRNL